MATVNSTLAERVEFSELASPRAHTIVYRANNREQIQTLDSHPSPPSSAKEKFRCSMFDIWALGIVIVIGGDFFSWNTALQAGFGSLVVSTTLTGMAYVAFVLCTSETFSGLPFSGGAYGLVRVTFGFYPGFLIGCSEAIEYIGYVSLSALALMSLIENLFPLHTVSFHILLLTFFFSASWIQTHTGRLFWRFNTTLGLISLGTVLCYCFGTLKWTNIKKLSSPDVSLFSGGMRGFLNSFPLSSWFFIGIESLSFASDTSSHPQKTIPTASITCVLTLFFTGLFVLFVASTAPEGQSLLAVDEFPLNSGFSLILNCSYRTASILSLPATFATAFGFIFSYSQLLCRLSGSGLVPSAFGLKNLSGAPYVAVLVGSLTSYTTCLFIIFFPPLETVLFQICFLSAYVTYACQCIAYVYIKTRFSTIKCSFQSPLGIFGALFALAVFLFAAISICFFQGNGCLALPCLVFIWAALSVYYFTVAKRHQKISIEEQKSVLVAHIIKYNSSRYKKRTKPQHKLKRVSLRTAALMISIRPLLSRHQSTENPSKAATSPDMEDNSKHGLCVTPQKFAYPEVPCESPNEEFLPPKKLDTIL